MLMTLRGVPVIYYGDEQGFAGTGGDQDARQDMFASRVPSYIVDRRIAAASAAPATFDRNHPLYRFIADLSGLRAQQPAFRGGRQVVRNASDAPGLFAVSRFDVSSGREIVIAFNTSTAPLTAFVEVDARSRKFSGLRGQCSPTVREERVYPVTIPPLEFIVCAAGDAS
jgi:glycosidase